MNRKLILTILALLFLTIILGSLYLRHDYRPLDKSYSYHVFFEKDTSTGTIETIRQSIDKDLNVLATEYISQEQAYDDYRDYLIESENYQLLGTLDEISEGSLIASITIYLSNYSNLNDLEKFIEETSSKYKVIQRFEPNKALKNNYKTPEGLRTLGAFKFLGKKLNSI